MASSNPLSNLPSPDYFTKLAGHYARQTADSTRSIFASAWADIDAVLPITSSSVVHDNAGGPGTAASVIAAKLADAGDGVPALFITDNNAAMVDAAKGELGKYGNVTAEVLDSQDLQGVPGDKFTHSIINFSLFLFPDAPKALKEVHRTLQPQGLAAVLTWKRFAPIDVINAAQAKVRPDLPLMKIPGAQYLDDGVAADAVAAAGFDRAGIKVLVKEFVVKGDAVEGLREFLLSDFTKGAKVGWTDEEVARWPTVVEEALREEVVKNGGVRFEAWVILARK